jgi:hypothetical protein
MLDPELQKNVEGKRSEDPKKILILDREGSLRTIDLVEEAKFPKREHNR